jgi:hypothetical protein
MADKDINLKPFKNSLRPLIKQLIKIKKQTEVLGIFTDDRELLECSCGLVEDVAFNGILYTYYKTDPKYKDTGLLFKKVNENTFICPVCKKRHKPVWL